MCVLSFSLVCVVCVCVARCLLSCTLCGRDLAWYSDLHSPSGSSYTSPYACVHIYALRTPADTLFSMTVIALCSESVQKELRREKEAFGFYFSAHPVEQYEAIVAARWSKLNRILCCPFV